MLIFEDLRKASVSELLELIQQGARIVDLRFTLKSIGITNDPADIARDFLDALFVGESLVPYCHDIDAKPQSINRDHFVIFSMAVCDFDKWASKLIQLSHNIASDEGPDADMLEEMHDFENSIFERKRTVRLPDLADMCMANFINGSIYLENKEFWDEKHPTLRHGFWKSFLSTSLGYDFYTSANDQGIWIALTDERQVEKLLVTYGGFNEPGSKLKSATALRINNEPQILLTDQIAIRIPSRALDTAISCWEESLKSADEDYPKPLWSNGTWLPRTTEQLLEDYRHIQDTIKGSWESRYSFSWKMTEDGNAAVVGGKNTHLIIFCESHWQLQPERVREYLAGLEDTADKLRQNLGISSNSLCDWTTINDSSFEDLCCDLLCRLGRFDPLTIRKHGRTNSRDGGRDIEIWTKPRLGQPGVKWIYQCKFITTGARSLSASRVSVSDVIDQYDVGGFGVMTNSVIDSTLYDKMDAISKKRGISVDFWHGHKLEMYVTPRKDLLEKYFRGR